MTKPKFMPCPFCGAAAAASSDIEPDLITGQGIFQVLCDSGHSDGVIYFTLAEASAGWNTRFRSDLHQQ